MCLWCYGREDQSDDLHVGVKRKNGCDGIFNKRQAKEEEIDVLFEKHGDNYSNPQLRLWACMIICGTHDNLDSPPRVPMIVGSPLTKRPKQESLTSALVGAVNTFEYPSVRTK